MSAVLEVGLPVALSITLVVVLAACVCGCRKDVHKSELVGTAGVVKLRFEEEVPPPTQTTPLSAKRASAQNSQRSLPEIPSSVPRQDSGDTASELYATVGTNQRVSEQSSPVVARRSDHPYEHAYARLQDGAHRVEELVIVNENLVGNSSGTLPLLSTVGDEILPSPDGAVVISASVAISGGVASSRDLPYMTPPAIALLPASPTPAPEAAAPIGNGAPQHFSGDSVDSAKGYTSISVREPLSSIRANSGNNRQFQPHYATVSDDSDEMYAAIEEPSNQVYTSGSETYAQIQPAVVQAMLHPAPTTSAPSTTLTASSTSATSSALSTDTTNVASTSVATVEVESNPRRSVEGSSRHHKHSRQASNSSCNSSVGTLGSPKPEKRQANSPLPPPPPAVAGDSPLSLPNAHSNAIVPVVSGSHKKSHDAPAHSKLSNRQQRISSTGDLHNNPDKLRRSLNEKHQRNNSCVSSSDFYGCNYPVDKHRFSSGDLVRPLVVRELNFSIDKPATEKSDAIYNTIDGTNDIYAAIDQEAPRKSLNNSQPNVTGSPSKNVEEMYAKVIKKSKHNHHVQDRSQPSSRLANYDDVDSSSKSLELNSNTAVGTMIPVRKKSVQNNDEDRVSRSSDPKRYSSASPTNLNINSDIVFRKSPSPGKNVNNQSLNKDDPGYETIDRIRNKNHGYETIDKNVAKHKPDATNFDPGYETVKDSGKKYDSQKRKSIPTVSGGLMQHSHNSVGLLQRITMQEGRNSIGCEPGYETLPSGPDSILSNDPGYEHIKRKERYLSDSDPNYEVLLPHNATPPYASIQNKSQPGYSVINKKSKPTESNWHANNNDNSTSEPNYESMPHEALYNTGSESDPNYESVGPKDPNYESVKYFDVALKDPPYEKVHSDVNIMMENAPGTHFQRTGSASSGYERVKSILKQDKNDNRTNGTSLSKTAENAPVADYFQV